VTTGEQKSGRSLDPVLLSGCDQAFSGQHGGQFETHSPPPTPGRDDGTPLRSLDVARSNLRFQGRALSASGWNDTAAASGAAKTRQA
jgi:hypothetical protein